MNSRSYLIRCSWEYSFVACLEKKTHSKTTESFFQVHHLLLAIAGFYVLSLLPILNNLEISKVTVQVKIFNLDENEPVNMKKTICPQYFSFQWYFHLHTLCLHSLFTSILILHWLKSLLGLDRITSYCC